MFGLFGKGKKHAEGPSEPLPPALGWEAIERAFERLYPGKKPRHWSHNGVHRIHDRKTPPANPLEGVNIYDGDTYWHYVSFGLSDLFMKESKGEWSGFGYELTFRIARMDGQPEPPLWPVGVMVNLARAQYGGSDFAAGHTIKTGSLDGRAACNLTALLVVEDPSFTLQDTAYGKLVFLQLVGVEAETRERALQLGWKPVFEELRARNPGLITTIIT